MKSSMYIKSVLVGILVVFSAITAAQWAPIQNEMLIEPSRPALDRINRLYTVNIKLTNTSEQTLQGPLRLLIDNASIPMANPDGLVDDSIPYVNTTITQLEPGESAVVAVKFALQRKRLTFDASLQNRDDKFAVYAQAEGGDAASLAYLGNRFVVNSGDPSYLTIDETDANPPANDDRVAALAIDFPAAGTYELYVRLRVGANGANDDSFFAPDGFGENNGWILDNGIAGYIAPGEVGYTPGALVIGDGAAATEVWMWHRFSGTTYAVPEGELRQTFRFAGREDGLDIDQFAFGKPGITYTVEQLENRLAGEVVVPPEPFVPQGPPLAEGKDKFLGGVCCGPQRPNFEAYWNQVTPENAGKWESVEFTRDQYNWQGLDEAYNLAKENGYKYKHHVLVWGNQQPAWIVNLPPEEQLEEILEWFNEVNNRYPAIDFIEVVNEFDNDPPDAANNGPNYIDALRLFDQGTTTELIDYFVATGLSNADAQEKAAEYDWIINSFQMARNIFPSTTRLMINEYSVINSGERTSKMIEIVNLLLARGLIDDIGFQGHAFSTTGPSSTIETNLNRLVNETGLDVYVTELDIDGPTDLTQLLEYQRLFPLFWENPGVKGITMWGYLPGHWREAQGANLAIEGGFEKPALVWLKGYVRELAPSIIGPNNLQVEPDTAIGTVVVDLLSRAYDGTTHDSQSDVTWSIIGGTGQSLFAIDETSGEVSVAGVLSPSIQNLYIQVQEGDYTSFVLDLQILIPGDELAPTVIVNDFGSSAEGWRGDYGTQATVTYDALAEAAVLVPDWLDNPNNQVFIQEIPLTDLTNATVEYTVSVTQAQIDGGLSVQGYVQTGAPNYSRVYGPIPSLQAGSNTFTFEVGEGNPNVSIVERIGFQLNGPLTDGLIDDVLLERVVITIPARVPTFEDTVISYDFATGLDGWRGDFGTSASMTLDDVNEVAVLLPNGTADSHNYIGQIGATDLTGSSIEYTVIVTEAQAAAGLSAQAYVQAGNAGGFARIYGNFESLVAGENNFTYTPVDDGNGTLEIIERVSLQINGTFTGVNGDVVQLDSVTVTIPGG